MFASWSPGAVLDRFGRVVSRFALGLQGITMAAHVKKSPEAGALYYNSDGQTLCLGLNRDASLCANPISLRTSPSHLCSRTSPSHAESRENQAFVAKVRRDPSLLARRNANLVASRAAAMVPAPRVAPRSGPSWEAAGLTSEAALQRASAAFERVEFKVEDGFLTWVDGPSVQQVDAEVLPASARSLSPLAERSQGGYHSSVPMRRRHSPQGWAIAVLRHASDGTSPVPSDVTGDVPLVRRWREKMSQRLAVANTDQTPKQPHLLVAARILVEEAGTASTGSAASRADEAAIVEAFHRLGGMRGLMADPDVASAARRSVRDDAPNAAPAQSRRRPAQTKMDRILDRYLAGAEADEEELEE